MTTYTHRNIHTGRLCYVEERRFVQGWRLYWVRTEHGGLTQLWHAPAFWKHHEQVVVEGWQGQAKAQVQP